MVQFLVFGPLSLFITVVHIWKDPRTFWLFVVQIVYVVIQVTLFHEQSLLLSR